MKWILIAIVVVPAVEIWGILRVGSWIGAMPAFLIILLTGFIGAYLARREGRRVWQEAQYQMQNGQIPGRTLLDGLCVLIGGVLLLTPGFLTDLFGFSLIFHLTRPFYRQLVLKWLEAAMRGGRFTIRKW